VLNRNIRIPTKPLLYLILMILFMDIWIVYDSLIFFECLYVSQCLTDVGNDNEIIVKTYWARYQYRAQ